MMDAVDHVAGASISFTRDGGAPSGRTFII
jgi:hypothetical protein